MLVSLLGLLFSLFPFISHPYILLFLFVGVSVYINILVSFCVKVVQINMPRHLGNPNGVLGGIPSGMTDQRSRVMLGVSPTP